mgnify:CR=1 FL=1|uniref:hypothetical protein n=1 Tax=Phocaeicola dorei TaxID=357276 RepID=UPI0040266AB3
MELNMLNIHSIDSYTSHIQSLDWEKYDDCFDNYDDYSRAWSYAIKEENSICRAIIYRFYHKGFMIKENVTQIYETLPAAIYLINHSPYYLNVLLDFLIDNFRMKGKKAGLLACLNNLDTYYYHYELDVVANSLDFGKIITYYRNDSIVLKKLFQIFALMPNPTNLLRYEDIRKAISTTFYSFALSISFKINGINEIRNKYDAIISSVKNEALKAITYSFFKTSNEEIKEELKGMIMNVWTQIASSQMYWLFPQESIGYWALVGYLDNWNKEEDLNFLNKIVSIPCLSFREEDELFRRIYDKSIPKQLEYYKSMIYSEHKISQIKGCLEYYRINSKMLPSQENC